MRSWWRSPVVMWIAASAAVLAVVAIGITANIALLDASDPDGLGELTPIAQDVGRSPVVVPAVPARTETTTRTDGGDDDHGGEHREREHDYDDD